MGLGEGTIPEAALKPQRDSASELMNFIQAFGTSALVSAAAARTHGLESLLAQIPGVRSARIELTETGELEKVQIGSDGRFSPAEVLSGVQSTLAATGGPPIDPRLISVVSLKEPFPDQALIPSVSREPRVRINRLGYQQDGFKIIAHVELELEDRIFFGFDREADTGKGRMMAAGRAALKALENIAQQSVAFSLEAIDMVQNFDRNIAVASVRAVSDLQRVTLVGCAAIADNPNYSAAQAVLAAVNRWLLRVIAAAAGENGRASLPAEAAYPGPEGYLPAPNGHGNGPSEADVVNSATDPTEEPSFSDESAG
jgi:hypothetical protein